MYAGPVQVYQTCVLVGTSLQNDMTAGYMQLFKTWEMAGCNCYRRGWWLGANVIYADKMKL